MIRIIETIGIVLFTVVTIIHIHLLYQISGNQLTLFIVCTALLAGYFAADLFSGLVHWVCDSFGCSTTPFLGPALIHPFRHHHYHPLEITEITLFENLGASAIAGVFVLMPIYYLPAETAVPSEQQTWLWLFLLAFVEFSVISNLFHRWSHIPGSRKPAWMRYLQKYHIILNSEAHLKHHRKPHRINYCILSGWANFITNRIPWPQFEKGLSYFGIRTNFL